MRLAMFRKRHRRLANRLTVIVMAGVPEDERPGLRPVRFGGSNDQIERLHGLRGKRARRRFARQHDRVDPIVDGVGGIADFGTSRTALRCHRFEHLGREDHGNFPGARAPRDVFLHARHAFERHLETQIAAGNHHAVRARQNFIEAFDGLRPFELGDDRNVARVGLRHDLTRLVNVGGALHEAERDHVHAERKAEGQIVDVFHRDR